MIRARRLTTLVTAGVLAFASVAATEGETSIVITTDETETLYVSAGCAPDTPGTCTSTRWLGTSAGDSTTNYLTAVTPVDEALYRAEGSVNWRDYPGDASVGSYQLTGDALTLTLTLSSEEGVGVNVTVHGRVRVKLDGKSTTLTAPEQVVNLLPGQTTPVTFEFDVAEHAGKVLTKPTVEVAVHGVNVSAGHIDQQGGSTLEIPYWLPVDEAA